MAITFVILLHAIQHTTCPHRPLVSCTIHGHGWNALCRCTLFGVTSRTYGRSLLHLSVCLSNYIYSNGSVLFAHYFSSRGVGTANHYGWSSLRATVQMG
jgi:hypothetical protein